MTVPDLLSLLRECPIVASVQASEGSPLDDPQTLLKLARASIQEGVKLLRLQGVENIRTVKAATGLPVMGLIKRHYPDSDSYITPTMREVDELLGTDCEIIGIDAVIRKRPGDGSLSELIKRVHGAGRLVLADVDGVESARGAVADGAHLVSSTLHGYTDATRTGSSDPGLDALRDICEVVSVPVFAEGRYSQTWQARTALQIGAVGVVIGSALNDTLLQTRRFIAAAARTKGNVGAVDIGGTWLRFAVFSPDWELLDTRRVELPKTREEREDWIKLQIAETGVERLGVGTGGVVNPANGLVWLAKRIIPGHMGSLLNEGTFGIPTLALNDGLASAWGHACHSAFAGRRVATLAIGTGVGLGLVDRGHIFMGRHGEPSAVSDLPFEETTIESALGGAALGDRPTYATRARAIRALDVAISVIKSTLSPDVIVICGSVGLSNWVSSFATEQCLVPSPFGTDAGLYGAAALALNVPDMA